MRRLPFRMSRRSYITIAGATAPKLLVANRGEIACRVLNTARRLGWRTVAVYCDAEPNAKHVQMADEAYRLGPPPASTSYLLGDRIVGIAKQAHVQAIHPGYGFLSENAEFATLCANQHVEFIGPPASAILSMGSKSESKRIMIAAGVPVTPGYQGYDQDPAFLQKQADLIGYPVLIKAAAGGGGRGMRLVRESAQFLDQLDAARREARKYFADEEVILERFVERARHVEVQVLADKHGNCVYLFERDCSVQRRHQKILEEAPAPLLPSALRHRMGAVAVAAAKAVQYVGAGTVEFLYDPNAQEFFFMEMNTRLQVEHPVSEAITGIDLVEEQIRVACGEPLRVTQADLSIHGHAIEARIYAEDTASGFLPGSGRLRVVRLPPTTTEGQPPTVPFTAPMVRIDSGFREGDDVLVHYDSMIAKLIVWAEDRPTALRHLLTALQQYQVVGVPTNLEFLRAVVDHPAFVNPDQLSTDFIQDHLQTLQTTVAPSQLDYAVGALAVLRHEATRSPPTVASLLGAFRVNLPQTTAVTFQDPSDACITVIAERQGPMGWVLRAQDESWAVEAECDLHQGPDLVVCAAGQRHRLTAVVATEEVHLLYPAGHQVLSRARPPDTFGELLAAEVRGTWLVAPMPGKIIRVVRPSGTTVQPGDPVAILEAMKMEHVIRATTAGILDVVVQEGQMVGRQHHVAQVAPIEPERSSEGP